MLDKGILNIGRDKGSDTMAIIGSGVANGADCIVYAAYVGTPVLIMVNYSSLTKVMLLVPPINNRTPTSHTMIFRFTLGRILDLFFLFRRGSRRFYTSDFYCVINVLLTTLIFSPFDFINPALLLFTWCR